MSFYTNSPNMSLPIPTVGLEPGPDYAIDINAALLLVDQHDHTSGNGVQITTQAININADLTLNSNALTYVKSITLVPDEATPAINMIYEDGVDLYFMDGDGNAYASRSRVPSLVRLARFLTSWHLPRLRMSGLPASSCGNRIRRSQLIWTSGPPSCATLLRTARSH
jgi:hypothetical protein